MADQNATPLADANVACSACRSTAVVAIDSTGSPACLRCRSRELEALEFGHDTAIALLEKVVCFVIEEEGMLHPDDAAEAVDEVIQVAAKRRRRAGLRAVPTIAETAEAADALYRYERLGAREDGREEEGS